MTVRYFPLRARYFYSICLYFYFIRRREFGLNRIISEPTVFCNSIFFLFKKKKMFPLMEKATDSILVTRVQLL